MIKAIQYANKKSAKSIAFTGFKGGRLARIAKTSVIIPAEDMQKIEDAHLILMHIIMQILYKSIGAC